jgi:hypothetical protein
MIRYYEQLEMLRATHSHANLLSGLDKSLELLASNPRTCNAVLAEGGKSGSCDWRLSVMLWFGTFSEVEERLSIDPRGSFPDDT